MRTQRPTPHHPFNLKLSVAAALAFALLMPIAGPVAAADLGAAAPPQPMVATDIADADRAATDHLRRLAVLLMIRTTFNVLAPEDVADELALAAARMPPAGPGEADQSQLDRDLLAEGGYYLVALRYLTETGGAAWPMDRPEAHYANDAIVTLDALQDRLFQVVEARRDPLPLFIEAQKILALTEGEQSVTPLRDRFSGRDEVVEAVLEAFGSRAST